MSMRPRKALYIGLNYFREPGTSHSSPRINLAAQSITETTHKSIPSVAVSVLNTMK